MPDDDTPLTGNPIQAATSGEADRKEKLKLTAYHEAAHAVADHLGGFSPYHLTIKPEGGILGHARCLDGYWSCPEVEISQIEAVLVSLYAGYVAQIEVGGDMSAAREGAYDDFDAATEILEQFGDLDESKWLQLAQQFVQENWAAISRVAEDLLLHETIDGVEIEFLVDDTVSLEELEEYRLRRPPLG
jgi:ATP-dependent Zn protease